MCVANYLKLIVRIGRFYDLSITRSLRLENFRVLGPKCALEFEKKRLKSTIHVLTDPHSWYDPITPTVSNIVEEDGWKFWNSYFFSVLTVLRSIIDL